MDKDKHHLASPRNPPLGKVPGSPRLGPQPGNSLRDNSPEGWPFQIWRLPTANILPQRLVTVLLLL